MDEKTTLQWYKIVFALKSTFGKKPDMNAILFLIGAREFGQVKAFSKEEKMDLIHVAVCKLLSYEGYYTFEGTDKEGWPHYKLVKKPPFGDLSNQETILKKLVVKYFEESGLID